MIQPSLIKQLLMKIIENLMHIVQLIPKPTKTIKLISFITQYNIRYKHIAFHYLISNYN